jgi:hypothetical protein
MINLQLEKVRNSYFILIAAKNQAAELISFPNYCHSLLPLAGEGLGMRDYKMKK